MTYWICSDDCGFCGYFYPFSAKDNDDSVCPECGSGIRKATKKEIKEFIKDVDIEEVME